MMRTRAIFFLSVLIALFLLSAPIPMQSGYEIHPWNPLNRESYPARQTSESVTIAVEPLYTNALAAQIFDKKDMVTRGIMPLAVVIFNDNDFPIEVDGFSIELINKERHLFTLLPDETVRRFFKPEDNPSIIGIKIPKPQQSKQLELDLLADFESKFLRNKIVAPHDKGGGFLYLHIPGSKNLDEYLVESRVYIPNIYRRDNRSRLIFFEIDLETAVNAKR
jgi:hypothetical protein